MTTLTAIVKVPDAEDMELLPEATREILASLIVVSNDLPLSKSVGGYCLKLVCFNSPGPDPLALLNGMISAHNLDWEILRLQEWSTHSMEAEGETIEVLTTYKVDGDVSPYLIPQPIVDAEGNVTGTVGPGLGVLAGQAPWA